MRLAAFVLVVLGALSGAEACAHESLVGRTAARHEGDSAALSPGAPPAPSAADPAPAPLPPCVVSRVATPATTDRHGELLAGDDLERSLLTIADKMSEADAESLEHALARDPTDIDARTRLLVFYSPVRSYDTRGFPHLLWFIDHCPAAPVLGTVTGTNYEAFGALVGGAPTYADLKARWFDAVDRHRDSTAVMTHAAVFIIIREPALAAELYERAALVDPLAPALLARAAHAYYLDSYRGDRIAGAAKALDAYERALALTTDATERWSLLIRVAPVAVEAHAYDKARSYASAVLDDASAHRHDSGYGDALHQGHLALGEIALAAGDLSRAKAELLAAADTPGSPVLGSFGPSEGATRAW